MPETLTHPRENGRADAKQRATLSLLDVLAAESPQRSAYPRWGWLKLLLPVMREHGQACQALAALMYESNADGETFKQVKKLAQRAVLPVATFRKHLKALEHGGWVVNLGRQRTRKGMPRRTCTWRITEKAKQTEGTALYGFLPRHFCLLRNKRGTKPSWSARAIFSVIMAQLARLKAVGDKEGHGDDWSSLYHLGGRDRFRFSLVQLERDTGITNKTLTRAKRELNRWGVILWTGQLQGEYPKNSDILMPNERFRFKIERSIEDGTLDRKWYLVGSVVV
jgi:hypothetical protein